MFNKFYVVNIQVCSMVLSDFLRQFPDLHRDCLFNIICTLRFRSFVECHNIACALKHAFLQCGFQDFVSFQLNSCTVYICVVSPQCV